MVRTEAARINYYVSIGGSDSNNGGSTGEAFKTIQKAVDSANSGDTINLAAGTYRQDIITKRSGTSAAPITP